MGGTEIGVASHETSAAGAASVQNVPFLLFGIESEMALLVGGLSESIRRQQHNRLPDSVLVRIAGTAAHASPMGHYMGHFRTPMNDAKNL